MQRFSVYLALACLIGTLFGDVHAEQSVYNIEMRRQHIYQTLRKVVESELLIVIGEPDPVWTKMAKMIIQYLPSMTCGYGCKRSGVILNY